MVTKEDTIILGGGLTGLSAASLCGAVVYEKEDQVGGLCRSQKYDGYTFDRGAHIFHGKDPYVLNLLESELGVSFKTQNRSCFIYSYGVFTKYPFQVNTYGLPQPVIKDCVRGFIESINKPRKNNFKDYKEWIYYTFGKGIAEHFYIPHSEKFWTVPVEEMTTDWLDVRVPVPKMEDVLKGATSRSTREFGPNAKFKYPEEGGMGALAESFLKKDIKVKLNKEAISIDVNKKIIIFSDGEKVEYNRLISTIPLPDLPAIIKDIPMEISEKIQELRCNSIYCIYFAINKERINDMHWLYFPEKEFPFFRMSFPNNLSSQSVPNGKSSITVEVPYSVNKPIDKVNIIEDSLDGLVKSGILKDKSSIELIKTFDIKYAYPIYDKKRKENVSCVDKYLRGKSMFIAGRFGRWEYQWMHDAILDAKRVTEEIKSLNGNVCIEK